MTSRRPIPLSPEAQAHLERHMFDHGSRSFIPVAEAAPKSTLRDDVCKMLGLPAGSSNEQIFAANDRAMRDAEDRRLLAAAGWAE